MSTGSKVKDPASQRELWEQIAGMQFEPSTFFTGSLSKSMPLELLEKSEMINLSDIIQNRLSGKKPIQDKRNWFLVGIINSHPKITRGSLNNSYVTFTILDLKTLSFVTPVLININKMYSKELELKKLCSVKIHDVVLLFQPQYHPGIESYSRCGLFANIEVPWEKKPKTKTKNPIENVESWFFILGKSLNLNLCPTKKCVRLIDNNKRELCDVHLSEKYNRLKGQRTELASSSWSFNLFDSTSGRLGWPQGKQNVGPESFLLVSQEVVTIYPESSREPLSAEKLAKQEAQKAQLRLKLSELDNRGGQMIKEVLEEKSRLTKKPKQAASKEESEDIKGAKLSVSACTELARKMMLKAQSQKKSNEPQLSGSSLLEQFRVSQTISCPKKIAELIKKVGDKKDH